MDERIDGLLFIEVGAGGGDGFGTEAIILGVDWMCCRLGYQCSPVRPF